MNKQQTIAHYKQIEQAAIRLEAVAEQELKAAARLKSEAQAALAELGGSTGRGRKVKYELTAEEEIDLISSLTK